MDRVEFEVPKNAKKRTRPISSYPDRTRLVIKDLLYGQKITPENFTFAGTKRAIPSGQDRPILPVRVVSHIINIVNKFNEHVPFYPLNVCRSRNLQNG